MNVQLTPPSLGGPINKKSHRINMMKLVNNWTCKQNHKKFTCSQNNSSLLQHLQIVLHWVTQYSYIVNISHGCRTKVGVACSISASSVELTPQMLVGQGLSVDARFLQWCPKLLKQLEGVVVLLELVVKDHL